MTEVKDRVINSERAPKKRVCDYRGYACVCQGYESDKSKGGLCVCGHAKSQHYSVDVRREVV